MIYNILAERIVSHCSFIQNPSKIAYTCYAKIVNFPASLIGFFGFSKRHSIGGVINTFVDTNLKFKINKKRRSSMISISTILFSAQKIFIKCISRLELWRKKLQVKYKFFFLKGL